MSYIIKSANPFASTKLTEKGREKLAKGQLTFNSWAIGDSEINYTREEYIDNEAISGTSRVLRPKDKQPDLKYFINTGAASPLITFNSNDIRCIKAIINNAADERGFFEGDFTSGFTTTLTSTASTISDYIRLTGNISNTELNGGTTVNLGATGALVGDFLLLKIGYSSDYTNETPTPHLWFKIQSSGATVTVDRELPNITSGDITFIVYNGGEVYDNEPNAVSYWDTGTLSFDSACDITVNDVPIWNMNIPFSEDILGITGTTTEKHINFGSYDYVGDKNNYLFNPTTDFNKSVGIIHYTNKTISNLYGEFLFIDNDTSKTVKVHIPDLMYHRRYFSGGTTTGDKMGMSFIASGSSVSVGTNGLTYIPLIEDADFIDGRTPIVVGRVYTDLKIIVITDSEILAAMSYKSNRNWTLPKLDLTLVNPDVAGVGTLKPNETMYVTYTIENNSGVGISPALACQNYSTITNNQTSQKDVQFNMEETDTFPFMRSDNTGDGFYGDTFKVIYQVTSGSTRPDTALWKEIDFSSSVISGSSINPNLLEVQNPLAITPRFQISQADTLTALTYSINSKLSMPAITVPDILQFGDERFFYGNIETFIGATIYKTLFKITINASDFNKTTNITRSSDPTTNPPTIRVSEVGIYDTSGDLVIISKLSKPIKLTPGNTVMIELSMDF